MTLTVGTNWSANHAYRAQRIEAPSSVEEVQRLVTGASAVRALGTRHSFNPIADSADLLLSTANLDFAPHIQEHGRLVTVGAGIRYGELASELQRNGWALSNLASLPHISVGGAIVTGTHGSGNGVRSLAASVAALEIVTASGDILQLRRGDADFDGAVVSLGALGIVTRVALDIQPTFEIAQTVFERLPFDAAISNFDALTGAAYSVSLFTTWQNPDVIDQVWLKRRPEADAPAPANLFGAVPAPQDRHPLPGISAVNCTAQKGVPGAWLDRLPHFRLDFTPSNGEELQSEFLVPREHATAALAAVRDLAGTISPLLQVCEVRTLAADSLWLSSAFETDAVGLHFTWFRKQPEVEAILPELEAALAPFHARPHWGKVFTGDRASLERVYPRLDDFRALAARLDPNHVFVNEFLAQKILPA
ncbi:D-arabinono-1,4-lactone oxidase [Mycetocola zhadangensis]|uniref:FAD-binding protein n=1 Tax=Mycetocola zhadangensis TaxID=1164595 RepID=A0A3L7IX85_9MICO|nr:D-arabinono-1,4-lactone oxidase [Mycetocola zhadangensis]RLQ82765.1 FAD-binding protein [Mycetocola zhadangensis]GGE98327.1 putative xylitol oxidase [Mycetocola zhadangensis]